MKIFFIYLSFLVSLYGVDFKVATYNVENFFDLTYDGTEYKEYKPHTKTWNNRAFKIKLQNVTRVINTLDADILALQELESNKVLKFIINKTRKYKYYKFIKNKTSAIGLAIVSKYPIVKTSLIKINRYDKYSRDILKATISIDGKQLIVYVNHWRSKRASESKRIRYAMALKKDINQLHKKTDYIILGDLNSNYNEYITFKYNKKLNDTYNITGINQILNTTIKQNFVTKDKIKSYNTNVLYNLWLELPPSQRFSSKFKNNLSTPDNILIPPSLFDNYNISYVDKSFKVFKPSFLYKNNKIIRWNINKSKGYSDHLPIYAYFSTNHQTYFSTTYKQSTNKISTLYTKQSISDFSIKNAIVIYKTKKIVIVKQLNDRAVMIYKPQYDFKLGYMYDFVVDKIDTYNGLKEIKQVSNIKQVGYYKNYKQLYKDGRKIDLFNPKYQNEIVKNLRGRYKKGYLYFRHHSKNYKIKLYFPKGIKRPKDGKVITIKNGHLSIYKSKVQIVLYH